MTTHEKLKTAVQALSSIEIDCVDAPWVAHQALKKIGPIAEAQEGLGEPTDEQIMRIAGDVRQRNAGVWPGDVAFAREVLAARASLPVKQAVAGRVEELVGDLTKWSMRMSYNDSYFGEPAGHLKRVVLELERLMPGTKLDCAQDAAEQPKLVLALPDWEKRRIVIGSDELIDGERLVCLAIEDPATPAQPDPVAAQVERAMLGEAQRIMAERYPAPVAGDVDGIDTPEFCDLITELDAGHEDVNRARSKAGWAALTAHINAKLAEARDEGREQYAAEVKALWTDYPAQIAKLQAQLAAQPAAPADPIVEMNVALLRARSAVGIEKYGTTLANSNLPMRYRLTHALEEALDQANYLQWTIQACDQVPK